LGPRPSPPSHRLRAGPAYAQPPSSSLLCVLASKLLPPAARRPAAFPELSPAHSELFPLSPMASSLGSRRVELCPHPELSLPSPFSARRLPARRSLPQLQSSLPSPSVVASRPSSALRFPFLCARARRAVSHWSAVQLASTSYVPCSSSTVARSSPLRR
jgi:hypothetical protein